MLETSRVPVLVEGFREVVLKTVITGLLRVYYGFTTFRTVLPNSVSGDATNRRFGKTAFSGITRKVTFSSST